MESGSNAREKNRGRNKEEQREFEAKKGHRRNEDNRRGEADDKSDNQNVERKVQSKGLEQT